MAMYQVVILGPGQYLHESALKKLISERISQLGLDPVDVLSYKNVDELIATAPSAAIYLGGSADPIDDSKVRELQSLVIPVQPVVESLARFKELTPKALHGINGSEVDWASPNFTEVVNTLLENFYLLRRERRLFISYHRTESSSIAHQLRVAFDDAGYDTFLDVSSVPKGDDFQSVLWHRLVDSDVVIVLDTPHFLESFWTVDEIAKAHAATVGMMRVVWPKTSNLGSADLAYEFRLSEDHFVHADQLSDDAVEAIVGQTEGLRARNIAARHANLVQDFQRAAETIGFSVTLQSNRLLMAERGDRRIAVIPTVGFPDARRFHNASRLFPHGETTATDAVLLYDHIGMLDDWATFLRWLDQYLPVKGLRASETRQRLQAWPT